MTLLRALPREHGNPFVFIGSKAGASLPPAALNKFLKAQGHKDVTVHGFRSTFMDWAHETTGYPKVVIDMALAHTIGDKVEASYRRGDLFAKRERLMAGLVTLLRRARQQYRGGVAPMIDTPTPPGEIDWAFWEYDWIDAIWRVEQHRDPTRLIALLAQGGPPPSVQPFPHRALQTRLGRKGGRPSILPSQKLMDFWEMEAQVGEYVDDGMAKGEACKLVAKAWHIKPKALVDFCAGSRWSRSTKPPGFS